MQPKTLDSLVREAIQEEGLTIHYYVDFLLHASQEAQRLSAHHKMSAKQVELTINDYNRVKIPDEAMSLISVSIRSGERLLPVPYDKNLNKLYNTDDQGNKIPFPDPSEEADDNFVVVNYLDDYFYDYHRYGAGGFFGLEAPQDNYFNVDYENKEIVFSNDFTKDSVVLTYAVDVITCTTCTLIRFEFWDVIRSYMVKMFHKKNKLSTIYEKQDSDNDYKMRKAQMRTMIYPVGRADFISSIRRGIHGGIKSL